MTQTKTAILKVPGASLYYEVTGAGPILLMIPGAPRTQARSPLSPDSSPTATRS